MAGSPTSTTQRAATCWRSRNRYWLADKADVHRQEQTAELADRIVGRGLDPRLEGDVIVPDVHPEHRLVAAKVRSDSDKSATRQIRLGMSEAREELVFVGEGDYKR